MKIKDEHTILLLAVLCGLFLWTADAAIDTLVSPTFFLKAFLFDISLHGLYFRIVATLAFVLFGSVISRFVVKHRKNEERYKNIVELSSDIIYMSNKDGELTFMNDAACRLLERSPEEVIGRPMIESVHPDDREKTLEKRAESARRNTDALNFENRYVTKSGKSINVLHNVRVLKNSKGEFAGTQGIARDITELKQSEEALQKAIAKIKNEKARSESIIAAIGDGISIQDTDFKVLYQNQVHKNLMGGDKTGEYCYQAYLHDETFCPGCPVVESFKDGKIHTLEKTIMLNDEVRSIEIKSSPLMDSTGKIIAGIEAVRDITERKQAEGILKRHHVQLMKLVEDRTKELMLANEKLRKEIADRERMEQDLLKAQKLESLGILAGGIAHDFNNFLASIMGNISLAMLDLKSDENAYRQLEGAEKASLRAQDLTRQLLTFSKGGAPIKRTTSIGELIQEAAGFALRGSNVKCEFSIPADLRFVDVDEGQVSRVIHNLVINADHAMPAGGTITIRCENETVGDSLEPSLRRGDYVKISVQDHGIGISKDHLSKIFDPYFTTKQKGSGLGLATSYSIIKKHGGHIFAESQLEKGTTFVVFLPASKAVRGVKKANESQLLTGTGKILLMDDEDDVRQTTGDVIKRLGYSVEFAVDGTQAIELYQRAKEAGAPFDAVIMDLTVPGGMGGKEALEKMLELDPYIKAIVSSGYSNDPIMAHYKKHGFKGVVTKPYRIKDLGETLHGVVRNSTPESLREQ